MKGCKELSVTLPYNDDYLEVTISMNERDNSYTLYTLDHCELIRSNILLVPTGQVATITIVNAKL